MGLIEDASHCNQWGVAKAQPRRAPGRPKTESIVSKRVLVRSVDEAVHYLRSIV